MSETSPPLTIHLFGPLRVLVHGADLPRVRTRSVEWLLALLALRAGQFVSRSWLAGTLWPESSEEQALLNLRGDLLRLRRALGEEATRIAAPDRRTLRLDLSGAFADVAAFDAALQAGDEVSLQAAVALYTAPLLEGCYEAWVTLERENRDQACLQALETLAERAQARGEHHEAIRHLRRAVAMDPLRDSLVQRLMSCLATIGDPAAAIEVYRNHHTRLHEELAAAPEEATTRLFQEIRTTARGAPLPERRSVATANATPRTTLPLRAALAPVPHPLTPLIGREKEVAEVQRLLQGNRLVTLMGGGGVGKTRLALEVAARAEAEFPDGAIWVELVPLADGALILPSIAAALGLGEERAEERSRLEVRVMARLGDGRHLLVLDNCEHLRDDAAQVAHALLLGCPALRVLATSRQRLGIPGEAAWQTPSLAVPDPDSSETAEQEPEFLLDAYPALQLLSERVTQVRPGFRLADREEVIAAARICWRLDGIPLALELAAARAQALSLSQIVSRLDDRFQLLTGGSRAALPRHQTLQALIDWSYDQLTAEEQRLLRLLSVFMGGWTLEAAEAVWDGREAGHEQKDERTPSSGLDVLTLLTSLVEKSLVQFEAAREEPRYGMLETVRDYAGKKRRENGEEEDARNRHLAYFVHRAEKVAPVLHGSFSEEALIGLHAEIGNFRAALVWAQTEAAPAEAYVQLAAVLWRYWEYQGLAEGRVHLQAARLRSDGAMTSERAQILLGESRLDFYLYELEEALTLGQESLALFRRLGDRRSSAEALLYMGIAAREKGEPAHSLSLLTEGLEEARLCGWTRGCALAYLHLGLHMRGSDPERARYLMEEGRTLAESAGEQRITAKALQGLGNLEMLKGDPDRAGSLLEQAMAIQRQLGDQNETALTLRWLGGLSRRQGDFAQAQAYLQEAAAISREQGHPMNLVMSLSECGGVFYEQGDYESARRAYTESLELFMQIGNDWGINAARMNLGSALFHLGEPLKAQALHREALTYYQQSRDMEGIAWALERLAVVEALHRDAEKAAQMLGAASVAREGLGKPLDSWDQADWDQAVATARAALGEVAFTSLWVEGRTFALE